MNLKKKQIVPTVHLERDFFFSCTKAQQMDTNVQSEKADKVGDTAQLMTLDFFIYFFLPRHHGQNPAQYFEVL